MNKKIKTKQIKQFIGGAWVDGGNKETFEDLNPIDDSLYAQVAKGTEVDVKNAVAAAKSAFKSFKQTTPTERERWLLRVAELMEERKSELIDCLIDEIGSPIQKAMFEF